MIRRYKIISKPPSDSDKIIMNENSYDHVIYLKTIGNKIFENIPIWCDGKYYICKQRTNY